MIYDYTRIRIGRPQDAQRIVHTDVAKRLEGNGRLFAAQLGVIGVSTNEGSIISEHPDYESWQRYRDALSASSIEGIDLLGSVLLKPSVRPLPNTSAFKAGIYTHRWYYFRPGSIDEWGRLSEIGMWPAVENAGANVAGLWSVIGGAETHNTLTIVRYDDMIQWNNTRFANENQRGGLSDEIQDGLRKRAELAASTGPTLVQFLRPIAPPA